jgi:hypothetical protein
MKAIVTTTIFPPSEATRKFAQMEGWTLFVAGDKKTPHEEYLKLDGVQYLTPEYQEKEYPELSELIGWNCIQRRNLAYVEAYKQGATVIASVDDDNIPLANWGKNLMLDKEIEGLKYTPVNYPVFDPLSSTPYKHLWHRGYPFAYVHDKNSRACELGKITPDVQANFWNGDPDVDAICRIEHRPMCHFDDSLFPFFSNVISPFNSQNTFFTRKSIRDFYVFPFVGRMDDIWGSYYCQSQGHKVVYAEATVYQERNEHDLVLDFSKEVTGYENAHKIIKEPHNLKNYIPERSWNSFLSYQKLFV